MTHLFLSVAAMLPIAGVLAIALTPT